MARKQTNVVRFESITEFSDYVSNGKRGKGAATKSVNTAKKAAEFSMSDNWEHAVDIAIEGVDVQRSAEQADAIKQRLGQNNTRDFDTVWDVAGDIPDVGLYLSGEPECMLRFVPQEAAAHIDLVVSGEESGIVDPEAIQQRAAGIASLCELLEQVNIYPAVYMTYAAVSSKRSDVLLIKAKDYSDPTDQGRLSGALWPSTLRRLMFKYIEMHLPEESSDGYGKVLKESELKQKLDLSGSYFIKSITEDCFVEDNRSATDYIDNLESVVDEWFNSIYQDFE
jgi:hypothetical protein